MRAGLIPALLVLVGLASGSCGASGPATGGAQGARPGQQGRGTGDGGPGGAGNGPDAGFGSVVVAAAGDIACDGCAQAQTAQLLDDLLATRGLGAILALGDNAYKSGLSSEYQAYYAPAWGRPELLAITRPVPGNHDYADGASSDAQGYFDYFDGAGASDGRAGARGQGYYSYDLGGWHLVALNSSDGCGAVGCDAGSPQETWLRADLAASGAACTLAYWHHPRFQRGSQRGDTPATAGLWNALADAGADVVLAAHEHNYQQLAPLDRDGQVDRAGGIRSFVVGTGGTQDFYTALGELHAEAYETGVLRTNGVLELTLSPGGYDWRFVAADGQVPPGASGHGDCH